MSTEDQIRETLIHILDEGVVVAVRLGPGAPLVDVCRALARGGLRVFELTLTTPGALDAIRALASDESLVVGGGTVLSPGDARRVADAGGCFAFSPVIDTGVIRQARKLGMVAVPGTATPTEALAAYNHDADLVKVFPAGPLGGADYIRKLRGPLPDIPLVPTSGPTADSLADYLDAGAVAVGVGGDELFPLGFTLQSVEQAARRVREEFDRVRRSE